MKEIITYLFYKKPITYIIILLSIGGMITYSLVNNYIDSQIKERIAIENLNKEKQKTIQNKEKELNPLIIKEKQLKQELDTLKSKIKPIQQCINGIKNSLNTLNEFNCNNSIIPKASAEEEVTQTGSVIDRDKILMDRICNKGKINGRVSPLCNNWDMYNKGKQIFESKGISWSIALGIMYAESHIGANYAGTCDLSYNNWGGIKRKILDDGTPVKDQKIPQNGCRLYKFNSIEDYFNSKANTLVKYKSCFEREKPIACISQTYLTGCKTCWTQRVATIAY